MFDIYLDKQIDELAFDLSWIDERYLQAILVATFDYLQSIYALQRHRCACFANFELGVAIVDNSQSQQLNNTYRQKNKPTNILSFESALPDDILEQLSAYPLGDLVICYPILHDEAKHQQKSIYDHFTHLIVHGVLHLLGYDHELGQDAQDEMERIEIAILANLDIANPYYCN